MKAFMTKCSLRDSFTKLLAELCIKNRNVSSNLREESGVGITKLQEEHSTLQDQLGQRHDGSKQQQEVSLEE